MLDTLEERPAETTGGPIRYALRKTTLGPVLVACSGRGICAVQMGADSDGLRQEARARFPLARVEEADDDPDVRAFADAVAAYIELPGGAFDAPLDVRGTEFQRAVWQALREIPAGTTASYTEIAQRLGRPTAVRAVAGACAANVLAVVIPCHRVVRSDGSLSGYRWGVERKHALLERERSGHSPREPIGAESA